MNNASSIVTTLVPDDDKQLLASRKASFLSTLRADHPLRPADWRWELSKYLRGKPKAKRLPGVDDVVQVLTGFTDRVSRAYDEISRAELFYAAGALGECYTFWLNANKWMRTDIESRILAGVDPNRIAHRLGLSEEAVYGYAAIYYDVSDRLNNRSCILNRILGGGFDYSYGYEDIPRLIRAYAYVTRDIGLIDELLDGFIRGGGDNFLEEDGKRTLAKKAALASRMLSVLPNKDGYSPVLDTGAKIGLYENADNMSSGMRQFSDVLKSVVNNDRVGQAPILDAEGNEPIIISALKGKDEVASNVED